MMSVAILHRIAWVLTVYQRLEGKPAFSRPYNI